MKWTLTIPADVQPRVGEMATLSVTGRVKAVRVNPFSFHPIIVELEVQTVESDSKEDEFARIVGRDAYQTTKFQEQWTGGGET